MERTCQVHTTGDGSKSMPSRFGVLSGLLKGKAEKESGQARISCLACVSVLD